MPVRAHRLEQLDHRGVVDGMAEQAPADHLGQVIVADRQRVGVAERALRGLGGRPHPDAGQRCQRLAGPFRRECHQPLQGVRSLRTTDHGARSSGVDVRTVELPGRDAAPHIARRRDAHSRRCRARGRRPVLGDQQPPGPKRVLACHPLLEHGRNERLQHPSGAAQPQMRHPPMGGGDGRLVGQESGGVVVSP